MKYNLEVIQTQHKADMIKGEFIISVSLLSMIMVGEKVIVHLLQARRLIRLVFFGVGNSYFTTRTVLTC